MKKILTLIIGLLLISACGGTTAKNGNAAANTNSSNAAAKATPTIDPNTEAIFPFKEFPTVDTTAKAGEVVLVPSYEWLQEATVKGGDKVTMIWYKQKMSVPDKEVSEVEFLMGDKHKVPNA